MSQSDLWSCKQALNNPDIDDSALLRLFRACSDAKGLLHAVVEASDERSLRLLLADRVDLSHLYRDNGTLLHVAYKYASLRIIDLLLDAGLNADVADDNGVLPWHMAAYNEDESVIARAIANGIDVNFVDARGSALVHFAACNDNGKVMAALMAAGAVVSVKDSHGQTPLHLAAYLNCPATVAQLVSVPCDANAVDESGHTPLLLAIRNHCSSDKLFKMLLHAGASVCGENDNSPSKEALRDLDDELLAFMINNVPEIDVNIAEREQGMTAMHVAVRRNNPELVATLITAGADVNALNKAGESPLLMFGALFCVAEDEVAAARVVQLLIDANADVGALDRNGVTACHHLANCGYAKAIELLTAAGANVSARARLLTDKTPLFFARNARVMSALIAANANVNALDRYNNTSCHAVCQREIDSATLVELLAVLRAACEKREWRNAIASCR